MGSPAEERWLAALGDAETAGEEARVRFHRRLDAVDEAFTAVALAVAEELPRLHRAFMTADPACIDAARQLVQVTHARIRDIEDAGFVTLAREAPVGGDLRRLVAILRLVRDVDRSAVNARHVCETLRRNDPHSLPADLRGFVDELAHHAGEVYRRGVDAWRRRDALAVSEVDDLDELVDRLQLRLYAELSHHEGHGDGTLTVGLIARYYERIADHGVAIARDTAFVVTGDRVGSPA